MASSQEFQENFFQCSICLENFNAPKVLHCQHTFCKRCIHMHIMQEVKRTPGRRGFPCPLCKAFTETNLQLPPEKWVDQLVTNFTLINMMEAFEKKHHVIKCKTHAKTLEYTCRSHQKKICSDCAVFDHRSCDIISAAALEKHEDVFVELSEKSAVLSGLLDQYSSSIKATEEGREAAENVIKDYFKKIREQVDAAEKDQLNLLQCKFDCELNVLKESYNNCEKLKTETEKVILELKSCDGSTTQVEACLENAERLKKDISDGLRCFNKKTQCNISIKPQSYLDEKAQKFSEMIGEVLVDLEINEPCLPENTTSTSLPPSYSSIVPTISSRLPTGNLPCSVGHYNPPVPPLVYPELTSNTTNMSVEQQQSNRHRNPESLTLAGQFNAKISTDTLHSWLTGVSVLNNGCLVLTDKNNKKIKLFSPSFTCIAFSCTDSYPFDVTQCYTGEIAVTLPKEHLISFYNPANLNLSNTYINTEQPCLGIVSYQEKLYVCCDTTWVRLGCIKVYDKYNNLIQKLDKDNTGKDIVCVTDYLTVSPLTGNLVFKRGGFKRECLYSISQNGTILWKARMQSWAEVPQGLVGLKEGVIAVCGGAIKWVSPLEMETWKELTANTPIESPCAVAMDPSMTKLIVTQSDVISNCKKNNIVSVFNIVFSE